MKHKKNTTLKRLQGRHRIGPHSQEVLSIIYGTLLGDAHLEQREKNVRISFQQEFQCRVFNVTMINSKKIWLL